MPEHPSVSIYRACSLVAAILIACSGCEKDQSIPVHPAQGTLTVNGQPATGAIVGLHPISGDFDERGTRPAGQVKADGAFTLSSFAKGDGAPAGQYNVSIFWPQHPEHTDPGEDRLMGKYAKPESSGVSIQIKEGSNMLEPIVLENVKMMRE
ncbi:carboxypeptidase regulatory-like domain-containing protein [Stieleria sp. JC731]|uniref:carboxypeptidase regulatory-like domain-containing protein n=1 Tax=Pirellulaceae TaxID=2691357 RepID=UPI001E4EF9D8|nr:carboxypeptidase regulatory-like domain-containing protein [Stieleria sp. JC731]MCC9601302.1 carboxypeptidase regulatory-like domain-containing protein [Stieleria sp. JC731]